MNILITGGTGLIGKQLGLKLTQKGHTLIGITRNQKQARLNAPYPTTWIECDLNKTSPDLSTYKIDGVIHLAGENVGERNWSKEQKEKILNSRTLGTKNLIHATQNQPLQFFIGASAIGIYNWSTNDDAAHEDQSPAEHFLAQVTKAWEQESLKCKARTVLFRIGVVLSTEGGALPKMLFPAQIFASSALGSGRQWLSWVHLDDVVSSFIFAIENSHIKGIYNLVAPKPCRQKEIAHGIAREINGFSGPPIPGFMLKLILGEQSALALNSLKVSSDKLLGTGFRFQFNDIDSALKNILKDWKNGVAVKTFQQYFPLPRERVFAFFSDAQNLEKITPSSLHFKILKISTPQVQPGTLIDYKLKVHQLPIHWRTEIATWEPNQQFTDTQLKGPYTLWHHTHSFEDLGQGTLMTDIVRYKLPLGLLGRLFAQAWVNSDVENIFSYRRDVVEKYL